VMARSFATGWEIVWIGPPQASPGRPLGWPPKWSRWRDEGVVLPTRWRSDFRHSEVHLEVAMIVSIQTGRLACEEMTIARRDGGPPISTAGLRHIPVSALLVKSAWAVAQVEALDDDLHGDDGTDGAVIRASRVIDRVQPSKGPLSGLKRDALLGQIAAAYRRALKAGDTAPRKAVAEEMGYSESYIGKLLVEARRKNILGAATPGRAGERYLA
jgi:hypothetical protein